jgi:sterol O-acyltransferase
MKMHSYMTVNGYLSHIKQQALSTEKRLHALVDRKVGGWNNAIIVAESRRADMDGADGHSTVSSDNEFASHLPVPSISVEGTGANTPATPLTEAAPSPPDDGSTKAYVSANNAMQLRQRLVRAADELTPVSKPMSVPNVVDPVSTPPLPTGTTHLGSNIDINEPHAPGVHPLVDHPDEAISALATELSELESELVSSGPEYVKWPNNITWKDFTVYMLIPSLCYELEYPRTDRFVFKSLLLDRRPANDI